MDTVIPVINIFLAEALCLSRSTFILLRNKKIMVIICFFSLSVNIKHKSL